MTVKVNCTMLAHKLNEWLGCLACKLGRHNWITHKRRANDHSEFELWPVCSRCRKVDYP